MKDHEKLNGHIQEIQWCVDSYINIMSGRKPLNQQECMNYVNENKYHASQVPAEYSKQNYQYCWNIMKNSVDSKKDEPISKTDITKKLSSLLRIFMYRLSKI